MCYTVSDIPDQKDHPMYDDFDDDDLDGYAVTSDALRRLGRATAQDRRSVRAHGFVGARILKPGGTAKLRRG